MPTRRSRLTVNVHRYTEEALRAYGKAHKLSLSGLFVTGAFLLARMVKHESDCDQVERSIPERLRKDLIAAYPDYDPEVVTRSLQRELRALGRTIFAFESAPPPRAKPRAPRERDKAQPSLSPLLPPTLPLRVHPRAPGALGNPFDPPGEHERIRADDAIAQGGLNEIYKYIATTFEEIDAITKKYNNKKSSLKKDK